jgi:hypothetical protein
MIDYNGKMHLILVYDIAKCVIDNVMAGITNIAHLLILSRKLDLIEFSQAFETNL